ncbi:MAG: hypothetical protein CMD98_06905 [Gammaproteobacteria bacterium]|nr:hypothetical protein [Gammaproteobacteria bacterium]|tara:strand:+ start:47566 stop:47826 length:261 start_codon:yes stop_codon:yes gene_type:complete
MPTYCFKNKTTGVEWEKEMKMSEVDDYVKENDCSIIVQTPNFAIKHGDGKGKDQYARADGDFRDRMKNLRKANPTAELTNPDIKNW